MLFNVAAGYPFLIIVFILALVPQYGKQITDVKLPFLRRQPVVHATIETWFLEAPLQTQNFESRLNARACWRGPDNRRQIAL